MSLSLTYLSLGERAGRKGREPGDGGTRDVAEAEGAEIQDCISVLGLHYLPHLSGYGVSRKLLRPGWRGEMEGGGMGGRTGVGREGAGVVLCQGGRKERGRRSKRGRWKGKNLK